MPRTDIPITDIERTGVAAPAVVNGDATNDHELAYNDGAVFIEVVSTDAGAQNVTIQTPGTVDGLAVADLVVSIPAGASRFIGPFPPSVYNQSDGKVYIDPAVSNTLDFRAYHLG